ncbi:PEP-CTERM sorting domain-containing protein [Simiduia curdlanivorans]|uniref:PEP-CTERM sorting domain-containing protein n=1 Tax=Simiduia curdlanivorans TaxID=1492769 RepID=A0ABV8V8Z9_9GAMM|nr:PEP-CTERM sorting domain-containing protein [Simiduia curdlanivorans]MDN3638513.1 PEP-CTERM sorting domain-containing protein [Simiduia curdlanivorans]
MQITLKATLISCALLVIPALTNASVIVNYNADAVAGQAAFISSLSGPVVVENFDGLADASAANGGSHQNSWESHAASYATNVGTFSLVTAGQGGSNLYNNHIMIESAATGEYGRETLSTYDRDLWLDSNDAREISWAFDNPQTNGMNAFGFLIADAADVGATLKLLFEDNSQSDSFTISPYLQSGNLGYVSVSSSMNIIGATLSFINSKGNDGWGIDDIVVGRLPEPGSILLLALGLLSLGIARKQAAR